MISTRNLQVLPGIVELRRIMQALAMMDAICEEEWEYRCFSFNVQWSETEELGSIRNGSGDELFAVFNDAGCFIKGFSHESPMAPMTLTPHKVWPGVLDDVPGIFADLLNEAALQIEDTTYCVWRAVNDLEWSRGDIQFPEGSDPDGSGEFLSKLDGMPETYAAFALSYFDRLIPQEAIASVFRHDALSTSLLEQFSSSRDLEDVLSDAAEIGYAVMPR